VASTLATKPEAIILDEPTTGLDQLELEGMMALIQRLNRGGHTILIVTHSMAIAAAYARRVILMCDGRIVRDGPAREIFGDESSLAKVGLRPPPVVQVANRLGVPALALDELVACLVSAAGEQGSRGAGKPG
jgi:energy-coupling factor transport system ATP-binding protein